MHRLVPLTEAEMTQEQREAAAAMAAGPRGGVIGPFVALLRSPQLMTRIQRVGEHFRWGDSPLPADVREIAVLLVARHFSQQFEWTHHRPLAERAGIAPAVIDSIGAGRRPAGLPDHLSTVHDVVTELIRSGTVGGAGYARAVQTLGEASTVELVALAGYYTMLAMIMNVCGIAAPPEAGSLLPDLP